VTARIELYSLEDAVVCYASFSEILRRMFCNRQHLDGPEVFSSMLGIAEETQTHRRAAKGISSIPITSAERQPGNLCRGCGKSINPGREHCANCAISPAKERLAVASRLGRAAAQTPAALAKQAESQRRHSRARLSWDKSSQPSWLTREFFSQEVQPLLSNVATSVIRPSMGVSRWYASRIRQGYRPHPRHWETLAELTGISERG
jgi:hypothetical protein